MYGTSGFGTLSEVPQQVHHATYECIVNTLNRRTCECIVNTRNRRFETTTTTLLLSALQSALTVAQRVRRTFKESTMRGPSPPEVLLGQFLTGKCAISVTFIDSVLLYASTRPREKPRKGAQ